MIILPERHSPFRGLVLSVSEALTDVQTGALALALHRVVGGHGRVNRIGTGCGRQMWKLGYQGLMLIYSRTRNYFLPFSFIFCTFQVFACNIRNKNFASKYVIFLYFGQNFCQTFPPFL